MKYLFAVTFAPLLLTLSLWLGLYSAYIGGAVLILQLAISLWMWIQRNSKPILWRPSRWLSRISLLLGLVFLILNTIGLYVRQDEGLWDIATQILGIFIAHNMMLSSLLILSNYRDSKEV